MKIPSFSSAKLIFVSGRIFVSLLVLPIAAIIIVAVYLAATSVLENIHFGRSADQIVEIVGISRNFAAREQSFASYEGEDLLASLDHAGLISANSTTQPESLLNAWNGRVTVVAVRPSLMRIETVVPARNCRRLAIFFAKDLRTMGVQLMEARQGTRDVWRRFYNRQITVLPHEDEVDAACTQGNDVSLALVLAVR